MFTSSRVPPYFRQIANPNPLRMREDLNERGLLRGTVVAAQRRADTAVTFCCSGGGPRQLWSSDLAPVSSLHSSFSPFPLLPSLTGHLASMDVKQNYSFILRVDGRPETTSQTPGV